MSEGYSYDLRRLQLMQLKILKEFVRVCQKHGFRFYIMNGTCLGAIRHGGFIPWDDDIDVGMYAEDYDRFIRCGADFGEEFFLQTIETDPGFKTMIARIRLNGTTILEKDFIDADIHHGVFIDDTELSTTGPDLPEHLLRPPPLHGSDGAQAQGGGEETSSAQADPACNSWHTTG